MVDQLGVFGRAEWTVSDRVLLTGGVRLNRETRRNDNFADNHGLTSDLNAEKTFSQVLPSGSFAYSLTPARHSGLRTPAGTRREASRSRSSSAWRRRTERSSPTTTSCLAGRAFPQSPSWNGAVGLGWRDPRGWFASGTFSYTDDAYTEIAAPLFTQVSSRSLLGGRVGYGRSGWSVYLWGANLLDDQYELAAFDGRLFGLPGVYGRMADPRAVGAGVDFDW